MAGPNLPAALAASKPMPGSKITDLPSAWRQDYRPGSFRSALFHCEAISKENARRIVTHQFPKKELPYSEDMGRNALAWSVRGYCIQFGSDRPNSQLYLRDYRIPRDALLKALKQEGPGLLKLPLMTPMIVVCPRYRITEEAKLGGYVVFDMQFVEYGSPPFNEDIQAQQALITAANTLSQTATDLMNSAADTATGDPFQAPTGTNLASAVP
jgi:prophage DNA circulation protein